MNPTPHPIAKIFAPMVFLTLALLTVGFSFGQAEAQGPETQATASK